MQCPKCKTVNLEEGILDQKLSVKHCQECKGFWIPADEYETWQAEQPNHPVTPDLLLSMLDVDFVQSPFDTKASLCPECRRYLSRAKVNIKTPFYIERCQQCRGIWCDHGEWEVLEQLGLHTTIEQLFSHEWQTQMRSQQSLDQERQATIEKLGPLLAQRVFELTQELEEHPNGDFAVAYMMRRIAVNLQSPNS
ncbi:MAG: zf-TFIIB domain-containing protein [Symploca sp. SIO3E6]|nr:zf-TFIIB domain-containing protein [Caldora sp. SIO3E6]